MLLLKAVSQLLWPDKDREEWFSLGENHEKVLGFGLHQLRNRCRGAKGLEAAVGHVWLVLVIL